MKLFLLISTFLCVNGILAQMDFFKNYTEKDGLSNNKIKCFAQDKNGFLWIGTNYGLNKFDGNSFEKFTADRNNPNSIASNNIQDITIDKQGHIWLATETSGVDMYDEVHKKFMHYTYNNSVNCLLENEVLSLFVDSKGNIWIGYVNEGWSKFNPVTKKFQHYAAKHSFINAWGRNASNSITGFAEDNKGNIWIASGYGLHCHNTSNEINTITDSTKKESQNLYLCVYNFNDTTIVLGTWAGGLKTYNIRTKKFATYLQQPNFRGLGNKNIFKKIAKKSDTELWLATLDKGLTEFNYTTKQFKIYCNDVANTHSVLPNECRTVFTDKDNILWAGFDYGFSQLNPFYKNIHIYDNPNSTTKEIAATSILELYYHKQNNTLYFGIEGGKGLYQQNCATKKIELLPTRGLNFRFSYNNYVSAIYYWNDNELLINIDGKYYLYDISAKFFTAFKLINKGKITIPYGYSSQLYNNEIWLLNFDKTYYKIKLGNNNIQHVGGVLSNKNFPLTKGSILLASYNDSLAWVYSRKTNELALLNVYTNDVFSNYYDISNGKIVGAAKQIIQDKQGCYWVTTFNDGLYKLWKEKSDNKFRFKQYTDKDGLPDMFLDKIVCDTNGLIWLTSRNGIIYFNPKDSDFKLINDNNGLPEKCYSINSISIGNNGDLYAGGLKHFFQLNTKLYGMKRKDPTILLKSFIILGKSWANDTLDINNQKAIQLNYSENFFSCEISVVDFEDSKNQKLLYKLNGLDKEWQYAGVRRFISYSNLKSGNYTLLIKTENSKTASYNLDITIKPPFWQTWWFYSVILLIITTLIIGLYKFRVGLIKKEEALKTSFNKRMAEVEMKALKAQMNPHFIFNSLNSINKYILKNDSEKASNYLSKFAKLIRLILENSEQNTVTLESELQLIKLYIEIEMLRFKNKFTYTINTTNDVKIESIQIPPMLIQPYVENAIWHGLLHKETAGHLSIQIHQSSKKVLQIIIEDDGIGRLKATELKSKSALHKKSLGTKISDDRIHLANIQMGINAGVKIVDLYSENNESIGTRVLLELGISKGNQ